jgi:hypothetical protein
MITPEKIDSVLLSKATDFVNRYCAMAWQYNCENGYDAECPVCGTPCDLTSDTAIQTCRCGLGPEEEPEPQSIDAFDATPRHVYNWYVVKPETADRLSELGEPVARLCELCFWGRTTTGASVYDDEIWLDFFKTEDSNANT